MIYNIDFDLCAFVISGFSIFFVLYKKKAHKYQNRIFLLILISVFISVFFDITSSIANSDLKNHFYILKDFLNYGFLMLHNIFPITFTWYAITVFGLAYRKTRRFQILFFLPFAGNIILFFLNPLTHCLFYYNHDGYYTHGLLFFYLYVSAFIYLFWTIAYIIKYGRSISRSKCYSMLAFLGATMLAVLIEMVYPRILIELFFESMALLGMMLTIENEDELLNSITGAYNRRAFLADSNVTLKNNVLSTVLVVKLAKLNYYSAVLGIEAMNRLQRDITRWLSEHCDDSIVYDCDNAHYVINVYDREKRDDYIDRILKHFSSSWLMGDINIRMNIQLCVINVPEDESELDKIQIIIDAPINSDMEDNEVIYADKFSIYQREVKIERAIRTALRDRTLRVFYQPIWSAKYRKIRSAEALARLFDDELGFIPPDEFIPLSEKNGLITQIGEYVFEEVCRFYTENKLDEIGIEYIEVNLSVIQCMSKNIADILTSVIKKYNIDPRRVNLEITESAFANNSNMLEDAMQKLIDAGFTFSMDDYGTGYSNFSYMFDMPFQIIKLDKSILWSADKNEKAAIILKNTIRMIHEMKLESLVEGVETEEQRDLLVGLGCDFQQGYYYTKPVNGPDFYEYCRKFNAEIKNKG